MIKESTLAFLQELGGNNTREWFEANRKRFEAAKKDIAANVDELIAGITAFDGSLAGLESKDAVFRIFRDVRFSTDKSPYKTNLGAWMARGGRKSPYAGYYFHIEPGNKSFIAAGSWQPPADVLKAIRDGIDYQPEDFRDLVNAKAFKETFSGLEGEKLRSAPKGYEKDHPALEFLKHKSFIVSRNYTDKEVSAPDFLEKALSAFGAGAPLVQFLNRAIGAAEE